jgi:hypothetical protein
MRQIMIVLLLWVVLAAYTSATTITFKNITKGAKHMATTPFVLDEGFSLTVSAAGVDSKGTPRPLDPGVALTWGADKTGILQISPVSGTFTAQFSAVPGGPGGLVTITCTGIKVTNAMIAKEAGWSDRTPVQRWLRNDPKSSPAEDARIRRVLRKKPHLNKP